MSLRRRILPPAIEGEAMRPIPTLIGAGLILAGAVWILQGLDVAFAPKSFMTAEPLWVLFGGMAVAAGIATLVWTRGKM